MPNGLIPPPNGFIGLNPPPIGLLLPSAIIFSFFFSFTNVLISNISTGLVALVGKLASSIVYPQLTWSFIGNFVLNGLLRKRIRIASPNLSFCKSVTVTNGVEAVLSFSLDFTSPHILLISSKAASSVEIK